MLLRTGIDSARTNINSLPHGSVNCRREGKHRRLSTAVRAYTSSAICVLMAQCQKVLTLMSAAIGAVDVTRWIIAVMEKGEKGEPNE